MHSKIIVLSLLLTSCFAFSAEFEKQDSDTLTDTDSISEVSSQEFESDRDWFENPSVIVIPIENEKTEESERVIPDGGAAVGAPAPGFLTRVKRGFTKVFGSELAVIQIRVQEAREALGLAQSLGDQLGVQHQLVRIKNLQSLQKAIIEYNTCSKKYDRSRWLLKSYQALIDYYHISFAQFSQYYAYIKNALDENRIPRDVYNGDTQLLVNLPFLFDTQMLNYVGQIIQEEQVQNITIAQARLNETLMLDCNQDIQRLKRELDF